MTSFTPSTQSYLFNHMSTFIDYRTEKEPQLCIAKNSVLDFITKNSNYSKFLEIVKNADMIGILNSEQFNSTIFVAENKWLEKYDTENMDSGIAKQVINCSTIDTKIKKDLLTSSPICYFYTKNRQMRLFVTNLNNQTMINNQTHVLNYDIECSNGIVHIVDDLLQPSQEHFMN
jgi:uncharacterized surface protein with fasciclin (FAS1) repeats